MNTADGDHSQSIGDPSLAPVTPGSSSARHLRPRGDGFEQPITTVELFFDLVYVFAVTQLSHMILGELTVAQTGRAAFLLLIVWWAWIYTTWMANWFDPTSPAVRVVLTVVMLASLLMAAALPGAFGGQGALFAASYVALMRSATPEAVFMHRLPELRGLEVAAEIIEGPASIVPEQAANRLPTEQAILHALLVGSPDPASELAPPTDAARPPRRARTAA